MKKLKNYISLIFAIPLFMPIIVNGQHEVLSDSSNTNLIKAAREIIAAAGICTLITLDEDGRPRARAMDPFSPENNFTVWFGTNAKSRKVSQIKNDPRLTLYYFDNTTSSYVMIYGTGQIIDGAGEKERHWKEEWAAFYPDYPEGYLLIKVVPGWMEVISETRGITGDSLTWQPPIVQFNN